MAITHTDEDIQHLKINKFSNIADYEAAQAQGLIGPDEISFVEEFLQPDWNQDDPDAPDFIKHKPITMQGIQGYQGLQGIQGTVGLQGYYGYQGYQGTQGTKGLQGYQGTQGYQGATGLQGYQGTQGIKGLQGNQGYQGTRGLQGLYGIQGYYGLQGIPGATVLGELTDVNLTSLQDGQALVYNESSLQWTNAKMPKILDDLDDVTIDSNNIDDKQILKYDLEKEEWTNGYLTVDELSDTDIQRTNSSQRYFKDALIDIDGNTYDVVFMGNQVWMAENLRTKHYADGTPIPDGTSEEASLSGPWYYEPTSSSQRGYGLFYNYYAVMNNASPSASNPSGVQGVAPNGWHVPSAAEISAMCNWVGQQPEYIVNNNSSYYAKSLCSTIYWKSSGNTAAVGNQQSLNNKALFNLLPLGRREKSANNTFTSGQITEYSIIGVTNYDGTYWSTSSVSYTAVGIGGYSLNLSNSVPVRCVYDGSPEDFIKELEKNNYFKYDSDSEKWTNSKISLSDLDDVLLTVNEIDESATYFEDAVTDVDGNSYDVVILGDQVWMAENLIANHYADGTSIANHTENSELYYPSSILANNLAPEDWHVSTELEWRVLDQWITNQNYSVGNAKAAASKTNWASSSTTNTPGYSPSTNNVTQLNLGFSTSNTQYAFYGFSDTKTTTQSDWYTRLSIEYNITTLGFGSSGPQNCAIRCLYNGRPEQFLEWMKYKSMGGQMLKYDKAIGKWTNGESSDIPKPTIEDYGKFLSVDDSGNYALVEITNSENVQY